MTFVAVCHNDVVMTAARMMRAATRSFLFAAVAGCSEIVDFKFPPPDNIPVVGINPGQFGFSVTASHWTFDNTYSPIIDGGTLDVGMAITGYSGGDGLATITDADNAIVFNQTLAGNIATGTSITVSGKPPFKVRIVANDYTGIVTLGVNAIAGG